MKRIFVAFLLIFLLFQVNAKDKSLKKTDSIFDKQGIFYSKDKLHYGYKNKLGKVVIPAIYKNISYRNENIFFVCDDNYKKYFINEKNKRLSDKTFSKCGFFHNGITYVQHFEDDSPLQFRIYNVNEDKLSAPLPNDYAFAGGFWDGVAPLYKNNSEGRSRCYLVDTNLEIVEAQEFLNFLYYDAEEKSFYMESISNEEVKIRVKKL